MTVAVINSAETQPLLVNVQRTARMLGLSERKVWQLVSAHELPTVRIGKRVLFDVNDLRDFIDARKTA